jgi:hypothetical protein
MRLTTRSLFPTKKHQEMEDLGLDTIGAAGHFGNAPSGASLHRFEVTFGLVVL